MFWLVCIYLTIVCQVQKLLRAECGKTIVYGEMERDDCGIFNDCFIGTPLSKAL